MRMLKRKCIKYDLHSKYFMQLHEKTFLGSSVLSVCSSRGCSLWPGMGRGGIQFCTLNSDMKPVLVLFCQEQNAVCVTYMPQVPTAGKPWLHLFHCPLGFHGSLLLAATTLVTSCCSSPASHIQHFEVLND